MSGVKLVGTGSALPSRTVTNDDLAKIVDTSDEWIRTRTGIGERHYCTPEENHGRLALRAAQCALDDAGIAAQDVGICLVATFTSSNATPSTACLLQRDLGLAEDTLCLDLNAACAGFVYALHVAEQLLLESSRPYALVVGADAVSRVLALPDQDN